MKTTIVIADDLLRRAKKLARAERTTLRALVEEGLRRVIAERRGPDRRFTLRDAAVNGRGIREGLGEGDWESVRDVIYRGRGS